MYENGGKWKIKKEKILLYAGIGLIAASFVNSEIRGGVFHYEYVYAGLLMCGIAITWGR